MVITIEYICSALDARLQGERKHASATCSQCQTQKSLKSLRPPMSRSCRSSISRLLAQNRSSSGSATRVLA